MMPSSAACATATGSSLRAARARRRLRALITDRVAPGVVYTTFHHPDTQANVITTDYLRLGDQLPGIQGDGGADFAVERAVALAGGIRGVLAREPPYRASGSRGVKA